VLVAAGSDTASQNAVWPNGRFIKKPVFTDCVRKRVGEEKQKLKTGKASRFLKQQLHIIPATLGFVQISNM
jgi:hypothetical protein